MATRTDEFHEHDDKQHLAETGRRFFNLRLAAVETYPYLAGAFEACEKAEQERKLEEIERLESEIEELRKEIAVEETETYFDF